MPAAFRRILVPHDFSQHADRALRTAAALVTSPRGTLHVLHVVTPFTPIAGLPPAEMGAYVPPADLIAAERRRLEQRVARLVRGPGAPRVVCEVVIGDPFHRILAGCRGMDVVVMATAGRSGLAHLLIGSVAEKVVRHAPIPVLTLRPGPARGRSRGKGRGARRR